MDRKAYDVLTTFCHDEMMDDKAQLVADCEQRETFFFVMRSQNEIWRFSKSIAASVRCITSVRLRSSLATTATEHHSFLHFP
jgi:hypothetical protein